MSASRQPFPLVFLSRFSFLAFSPQCWFIRKPQASQISFLICVFILTRCNGYDHRRWNFTFSCFFLYLCRSRTLIFLVSITVIELFIYNISSIFHFAHSIFIFPSFLKFSIWRGIEAMGKLILIIESGCMMEIE